MITGRCACENVRYEVDGGLSEYCHCHCSICRRLHGAAFASWGEVSRDAFRYVAGEDRLKSYPFSESSKSLFCDNCGSRILVESREDPDKLYIALGTVDGDLEHPPGFHQFVGSKAEWFEIADELPQHDTWPEDD